MTPAPLGAGPPDAACGDAQLAVATSERHCEAARRVVEVDAFPGEP